MSTVALTAAVTVVLAGGVGGAVELSRDDPQPQPADAGAITRVSPTPAPSPTVAAVEPASLIPGLCSSLRSAGTARVEWRVARSATPNSDLVSVYGLVDFRRAEFDGRVTDERPDGGSPQLDVVWVAGRLYLREEGYPADPVSGKEWLTLPPNPDLPPTVTALAPPTKRLRALCLSGYETVLVDAGPDRLLPEGADTGSTPVRRYSSGAVPPGLPHLLPPGFPSTGATVTSLTLSVDGEGRPRRLLQDVTTAAGQHVVEIRLTDLGVTTALQAPPPSAVTR